MSVEVLQDANVDAAATRRILTKAAKYLSKGTRLPRSPGRSLTWYAAKGEKRAGLIPMAIEEQLRYTSPVQNMHRYTRAAYQVGDVTIPSGSRVLMSFGAANRDPLAFDEPNTFRADRNPRTHVAFGYGAHMCLGAPLARMEVHAVLRELVSRVSRISATGPTTWSTNSSLRGPTRLPIVLHRGF